MCNLLLNTNVSLSFCTIGRFSRLYFDTLLIDLGVSFGSIIERPLPRFVRVCVLAKKRFNEFG